MSDRMKSRFEELNMTKDELTRLTEAMKKDEFRKLLVEYAEEISDPKNRELYEKEIAALERERGMNVIFINPEPGFCLKTSQNGAHKCFINICQNSNVDKPTSAPQQSNNRAGLCWHIPHTCSPPRQDLDKNGKDKCTVYDVVFHKDAYRMGETNERFQRLLKDTAFDSVERHFSVKLDRVNVKVLKHLKFKGRPTATVIRRPESLANAISDSNNNNNSQDESESVVDPVESLVDQLKQQYLEDQKQKYKVNASTNSTITNASKPKVSEAEHNQQSTTTARDLDAEYTVPVYKLIHRGEADIQDHVNTNSKRLMVASTRPKELLVKIDLPLCKSSEHLSLDIFEKQLLLKSTQPNYLLDLKLPYPINEKESRAKFDKSKRCLNVSLPVVPFVEKLNIISVDKLDEEEVDDENDNDNYSHSLSPALSPSSTSSESNIDATDEISAKSNNPDPDLYRDAAIKFNLPTQIKVTETPTSFKLTFQIANYDRDSIEFTFDSTSSVLLKCSSTSSGGYTSYYSAFIHFVCFDHTSFSSSSSLAQPYSCINKNSSSEFNAIHIDEDFFEIRFVKHSTLNADASCRRAAFLLTEKLSGDLETIRNYDFDKYNNGNAVTIDIKQEQDVDVDGSSLLKQTALAFAPQRRTDLNDLTKKDFIYNFKNLANARNNANNSSDDEDDNFENDQDKENVSETTNTTNNNNNNNNNSNNENLLSKAACKNFELLKFQQRKAAVNSTSSSSGGEPVVEKIDEESEENDEDGEEEDDAYDDANDFIEKDFLASGNEKTNNNIRQYSVDMNNSCLSSSFSTNEDVSLGSSLNSARFSRLKSILKKTRSYSESENVTTSHGNCGSNRDSFQRMSSFGGSDSIGNSASETDLKGGNSDLHGSKKSVSFNNQVVRNVFKTGSTVCGMKKPNSNKNKKKNKRKRTVSDPSHDATPNHSKSKQHQHQQQQVENSANDLLRSRSISESTDDDTSAFLLNNAHSSNENLGCKTNQPLVSSDNNNNSSVEKDKQQTGAGAAASKKKKNKKNKNKQTPAGAGAADDGNHFDVATMLEWKNQEKLSDKLEQDAKVSKATHRAAAITFKNRIMNDLDD